MNYPLVRLDECARIVSGATPSTNNTEFWGGDILWATPADLSELDSPFIAQTPRTITPAGLANCAAEVLPANSVLFSSRAPIGHVAINTAPMATNQGFKSFVPAPTRLNAQYLYHWLRANSEYLKSLGNGATFKEVSKAIVSRIEIPLPPIDEQRRIAAILDQADDLRRKRRESLDILSTLPTGVFRAMFGDPRQNNFGLPIRPLGEIVENQDSLRVPVKAADRNLTAGKYPYYGASGIIDYVESFLFEGERLLVGEDGANLLARSSPIAFRASGRFWVNNHAHVLADSGAANLTYLEHHFAQIDLSPSVTGTAQPKLTRASLDRLPFLYPARERQDAFSAHIEKIDTLKTYHRAHLAKLDALFASLQHRAFRGEL